MEYKDPMHELLSSTEQIVFKDGNAENYPDATEQRPVPKLSSYERDRVKIDDFARVLGVSVIMVKEMGIQTREAFKCRTKIDAFDSNANPALSKQLME